MMPQTCRWPSPHAWPDNPFPRSEAKFTTVKHHWWWKAAQVFDRIELLQQHNGLKLFLEEDYYVSSDLLVSLDLLRKADRHGSPMITMGMAQRVSSTGVTLTRDQGSLFTPSRNYRVDARTLQRKQILWDHSCRHQHCVCVVRA